MRQVERPASAPALLRGDAPLNAAGNRLVPLGGSAREKELGEFRQEIENKAVHRRLNQLRREARIKKDAVEAVDMLADAWLFDLKVKHNSAQRARSAAKTKAEAAARQSSLPSRCPHSLRRATAADLEQTAQAVQLRKLAADLARDTRGTCQRLGLSHKILLDPRLRKIALALKAATADAGKAAEGGQFRKREELANSHQIALTDLKTLFSKTVAIVHKEDPASWEKPAATELDVAFAEDSMAHLAEFLVHKEGAGLGSLLAAMDFRESGWLRFEDFAVGLDLLGYPGHVDRIWRHLDSEYVGELSIADLEGRLRQSILPSPTNAKRSSMFLRKRSGRLSVPS